MSMEFSLPGFRSFEHAARGCLRCRRPVTDHLWPLARKRLSKRWKTPKTDTRWPTAKPGRRLATVQGAIARLGILPPTGQGYLRSVRTEVRAKPKPGLGSSFRAGRPPASRTQTTLPCDLPKHVRESSYCMCREHRGFQPASSPNPLPSLTRELCAMTNSCVLVPIGQAVACLMSPGYALFGC